MGFRLPQLPSRGRAWLDMTSCEHHTGFPSSMFASCEGWHRRTARLFRAALIAVLAFGVGLAVVLPLLILRAGS